MLSPFPKTKQLESKDCGPACLQILSKYYGRFYEMEYLRELCGIKKEGISVFDLIQASEKIGFNSQAYRLSYWKFRNEIPLPCIVHWKGNHFMVVYKITSKYIYVSDPQDGLTKYSLTEFANGWLTQKSTTSKGYVKKRGVCIVSEPTRYSLDESKSVTTKGNQTSSINVFKFLLPYLTTHKVTMAKVFMLLAIITFLNLLFPIITQNIIDVGIPAKDYNFISIMLVAGVVLTVSMSLGKWMQQLLTTHFAVKIKLSMQSDFIKKLFQLPLSFFESRLMGDIIQRSQDYDRLESFVMNSILNFSLSILQFIVFGIILLIYNKTILFTFLIGTVLYIGWILFFWNIRKKMDIRYFSLIAKTQSQWIEMLSNMTDIKSYNYGIFKRWQWEKVQIRLFKTKIKLLNIDQIQNFGSSLIDSSKNLILIYIASIAVTDGNMSMGMLIAVQYIIGQMNTPMESIIQFIVSIQLTNIGYLRIQEVINKPTEDNDADMQFKSELWDSSTNIVLQNVYFRYNINDDYILRNITCTIPKGKMIAVVGESGSGKTTILKLLSGLYKPTSGHIQIGNIPLSTIPIDQWRDKIGLLSQESKLLNDTILNNIVFGRKYDADRLRTVIELANIKSDIERRPMGFHTIIQENGRGVSEGQKQRILFARAIYNLPEFLFLDELTSSLDSNNELSIIDAIRTLSNNPTTIIVAHRLSSVKKADIIIVLKEGHIAEIGTHNKLYAQKGVYYSLFKNQESITIDYQKLEYESRSRTL